MEPRRQPAEEPCQLHPEPASEFGHGLRAALQHAGEPGRAGHRATERSSPELALVCPELRLQWIDALPDREPDGFLPEPRPAAAVLMQARVARRRDVLVAAVAYLAAEAAQVAVTGVAAMGAVAGAITLATWANGI